MHQRCGLGARGRAFTPRLIFGRVWCNMAGLLFSYCFVTVIVVVVFVLPCYFVVQAFHYMIPVRIVDCLATTEQFVGTLSTH
jgi:hypothetical protein